MNQSGEHWEPLGKGVRIAVDKQASFGADAVFLADFARPGEKDRVCDFGTGCGILPMLWKRDGLGAYIDGVELRPEAAGLFAESIEEAGLSQSVRSICADLRQFAPKGEAYDLVTCNPPYFTKHSGTKSPEDARQTARQEESCTLADVVRCAERLLKAGGRLCLCHRPERLCDCLLELRAAGLEPKILRFVQRTAKDRPWLLLLEGRKGAGPGLLVREPLLERQDDRLSEEYRRIYGMEGEDDQWQEH